ncbi:Hpt domain-containing protein [Ideonella sp. A 288]|uniref:Hpt domain-containing protein n=1 Tax=Ideonella sp. A 288 TaxID=1962181 RepID=UPI001F397220|nr:Hpt domain-containing protein [Ideonella sp. A 288]
MVSMPESGTTDDLSALSWVADEVHRSLDAAHKALRRCLKEAEASGDSDLASVDPSVLRQARAHFHQSVGALELVGLGVAAQPLRASEAAVQRMSARPGLITAAAVHTIEHGSFALLDYLSRKLSGKPVSPLSLFPQYRALQELAGAPRAHPADLWGREWEWRSVPADGLEPPRAADATAVGLFEAEMLGLMRSRPGAAARLGALCAGLAAGSHGNLAAIWQLAAGFLEALSDGLLAFDVHAKRAASRLLAQLRAGPEGQASDRLAQDLLFFCAQATPSAQHAAGPRLSAARRAYGLDAEVAVDYESSSLGRFDPALVAQARKRVTAAKEVWSAVAAGELARLSGLTEPFSLVGDSLNRLYPNGVELAQSLQSVAQQCQMLGAEPSAPLAMEVATALLYLDASLEDAEFDHAEMPARVRSLADRLDEVRQGHPTGPLEAWMEDLYRRVSDRQTIGNVVQELRAALSEVEKQIDQYFRNPAQRDVLIPVPSQLSSMRGVLSLLDMDQASQAVLRMRDDVDALASTEVDPERAAQTGTFDRLADNLGALSFLIDMVSVQPQMAKSLFRFDAATGQLQATMGRAERPSGFSTLDALANEQPALVEQAQTLALAATQPQADPTALGRDLERLSQQARAADQAGLAEVVSRAQSSLARATQPGDFDQARRDLAESISEFVSTQEGTLPEALEPSRPIPPPGPPAAPGQTGLEDDAEMREIFLEEAREVVATARQGLADLRERPDDLPAMTVVRRAFHTLKGSARMVGLGDLGDAAWACEQLYNARLADSRSADGDFRGFSHEVLDHFEHWVDAIEAGDVTGFGSAPIVQSADALRLEGHWVPLASAAPAHGAAPAVPTAPAPAPAPLEAFASEVEPPQPTAAPEPEAVDLSPPWPDSAAMPDVSTLQSRVPDLPSATDLDLSVPEIVADLGADWVTLPSFDLSSETPAGGEPLQPMPEGLIELDLEALESPETPAPPAAEAIELDLASLPDFPAFAGLEPAVPPPEPVPLPDLALPDEAVADTAVGTDLGDVGDAAAPPFVEHALDDLPGADLPGSDLPVADPLVTDLHVDDLTSPAEPAASDAFLAADEEEQFKVIGDLRVSIPLFNIYLNEADELSRRLSTDLAEWAHELYRPAGETPVVLAHSLAGSSATVGFSGLSQLARALEHALMRSNGRQHGRAADAELFGAAAEEIRRLLHQFAAGFLRVPDEDLLQRLFDVEHAAPEPLSAFVSTPLDDDLQDQPEVSEWVAPPAEPEAVSFEAAPELPADAAPMPAADAGPASTASSEVEDVFGQLGQPALMPFEALAEPVQRSAASRADALGVDEDIDAVDAIDAELFEIFEEEASELIPQLQTRLREWAVRPEDHSLASACMRTLHTLKGSARLAGAMRLGEMAHRLESAVESLHVDGDASASDVDKLVAYVDVLEARFDVLRQGEPADVLADQPLPQPPLAQAPIVVPATAPERRPQPVATMPAHAMPSLAIDWTQFEPADAVSGPTAASEARVAPAGTSAAAVRVRAPLLDRLVNHAGEVSITRARIESDVGQMKVALGDLTENLERLRSQLRDIELQAETQIDTRLEAARAASQVFDPLEMDRFTRFQELTRMMAESVNDVATVQRGLQRTLQSTEDELAHQARLTRDLQEDLLRTRMVEFDGLSERLYRVVRQAAKETGKQVRLDIAGGTIEIDRGVLDRMTGAFEHLLRNSVVHGIETPAERVAAGKDAIGTVTISVAQEGNEVAIDFRDDGAGLDLQRIRDKALAGGLIPPDAEPSEADLAAMIFQAGFSTVDHVTGLAGRGVGMDVVRSDVNAMGGRIVTSTAIGRGTSFRLVLPLTTAVTQVVLMRCAELTVAVPSTLVEIVRRVPATELAGLYERGLYRHGDADLPFHWLGSLLQGTPFGSAVGRTVAVVVIRSAAQRIALHVDEVLGNQEVVVKNLGPQLSRLPGLAGLTLLPSGAPTLIYNPVALAALYGQAARGNTLAALGVARLAAHDVRDAPAVPQAPLVLVVDDSLTVRRVTQRLLVREGYRVLVAKDGLDGLERLADELPAVVLTDIEMPRMDGFDLVRNMRADARLARLPVIMITSRIAQKHRDYAAELGVSHYLGKPYVEDDLLALVARYANRAVAAA